MNEANDALAVVFFGSVFVAWLTQEVNRTALWLTIAAVSALILAVLALVRLLLKLNSRRV